MATPIQNLCDTKPCFHSFQLAARGFNSRSTRVKTLTLARLCTSALAGALALAAALDVEASSWGWAALLLRILSLLAVTVCNHLSRPTTEAQS
jgi:fatty acid desaturase